MGSIIILSLGVPVILRGGKRAEICTTGSRRTYGAISPVIGEHLDFAIGEFRDMKMQPSLEGALRHREILRA